MMATVKHWVTNNITSSSGWLICAPLLAAYAPRDLPKMYFNLHLRRYARRLVPLLDPFVTIDIVSKSSMFGESNDAYEEVKAYLSKECSLDVLEFCAKDAVDGRTLLLSLGQGQEVADHFQGSTVWWLLASGTSSPRTSSDEGCLRLMFPQMKRELILNDYLPHVRRIGRDLRFVTIDIIKTSTRRSEEEFKSSDAFEEVKAYLNSACLRNMLQLCAEGTAKDDSFLLSLREGHEVADHFQGTTVWWLLVPETSRKLSESCLRLMFPQMRRELILNDYLPHVRRTGRDLRFVTIDIIQNSRFQEELKSSDAFEEVKAYLSSACSRKVFQFCAEDTAKDDSFLLCVREGQEVADHFQDITLWWSWVSSGTAEKGCLRLMFPHRHRGLILDKYLPHIRREGRNLLFGTRSQRLYTNKRGLSYRFDGVWSHIEFEHPSTFDTLAMHPTKKRRIMEDLDSFRRSKDYYCRIGKPWKRGYLLYGPPGTGKSTMIAAMANYLNYDIYDIELTTVDSNSDLRKLFVGTKSKSIIVIEDIDCSFHDLTGERGNQGRSQKKISPCSDDGYDSNKVTLSGLLNFIDGVWSAQTGEQIIVLTSNFPDKLDPALIRRGRMDMHVEMSYCCFEAFKTLARNYLGVEAHPLFVRVEELLQVVEITPADVAECLLPSQADVLGSNDDRGVETCLGHLIDELKKKTEEKKAKGKVEDKAAAKPKRRRRY